MGVIMTLREKKDILKSADKLEKLQPASNLTQVIDDIGFGRFQVRLIIILGFYLLADAMEILLLSVIGPELKCKWFLTPMQVALITTIVFLGMATGSLIFSWVSDNYGRVRTLTLAALITVFYGLVSGASLNYKWLLINRYSVGIGIGGILSTFSTILMELLPSSTRGKGLVLVMSFWGVGSLIECGFVYLIMPTIGWRLLVVVSAIPVLFCTLGIYYIPESPHFLLIKGEYQRAIDVVNTIAKTNHKPVFKGHLAHPSTQKRSNYLDLFHRKLRLSTCLLAVVWFNFGFSYYGSVLISTTLPTIRFPCLLNSSRMSSPPPMFTTKKITTTETASSNLTRSDSSCCTSLDWHNYFTLTLLTLGENLSFMIAIVLCEYIGRRWSLRICAFVTGITFFMLNFCLGNTGRDILLFTNRSFSLAGYYTGYLYTTEIFPTTTRSLGLGLCSAFSRLGAITTPFVAQVMLREVSVLATVSLYTGVALTACVAACCLPIETKGSTLGDTVGDDDNLIPSSEEKLSSSNEESGFATYAFLKKYATFSKHH